MRQVYDLVYCVYQGRPIKGRIEKIHAVGDGDVSYWVAPLDCGYAYEVEDIFDTKEELAKFLSDTVMGLE